MTLAIYYGISVIVAWVIFSVCAALDTSVEKDSIDLVGVMFLISMIWPVFLPIILMSTLVDRVRAKNKERLKRKELSKINLTR